MAFKTYNALLERITALEEEVAALRIQSIPIYESFNLAETTNTITLNHNVNTTAPVWVTFETLPQKINIDYTIEENILTWINPSDPTLIGHFEIIYYRI